MKKTLVNQQLLLVILLLSYSTLSSFAQVTLETNEETDLKALYFWYADPDAPSHTYNRNISPKGDCFDVSNGYVFYTWYKGGMQERNVMLSRKKIDEDHWVTIEFPEKLSLHQGEKNGKDVTGAGDSHRTAALGICAIDSTVHLTYDMHCNPLNYRVSKKGVAYAPDSLFVLENFFEERNYLYNNEPIENFTYPNFINNNAGELIIEYRLGTARQGDKYITYYDGNAWSPLKLLVKGNNVDPQFNQYGDLSYHFGEMYLGCCVRVYGSTITNNQGFYFAKTGQRGNGTWTNLAGKSYQSPIYGLTLFDSFKIASPLPTGHSGMTSGPEYVISKNGAVHFTNQISGLGVVHYYTPVGSTEIKSGTSSGVACFGGEDGRVYGVELVGGNIRIKSTMEGTHTWRTDYVLNHSVDFVNMAYKYHQGKVYMVATELADSDEHKTRFIILDLNIKVPAIEIKKPQADMAVELDYTLGVEVSQLSYDEKIDSVQLFFGDSLVRSISTPPYLWGTYSENYKEELNGWQHGRYSLSTKAFLGNGDTYTDQVSLTILPAYNELHQLGICTVSASADDGNVPNNVVDGIISADSRWSANGVGEYLTLDLCDTFEVSAMKMAWYKGDERSANFEIQTSLDGESWTSVYTGNGSGLTAALEDIPFDAVTARYVRYLGQGNSSNTWNSITEWELYGKRVNTVLNLDELKTISLSPNPTDGMTYLPTISQWALYNLQGQILKLGYGKELDLSAYQRGVYLVSFDNSIHRVIKK